MVSRGKAIESYFHIPREGFIVSVDIHPQLLLNTAQEESHRMSKIPVQIYTKQSRNRSYTCTQELRTKLLVERGTTCGA